MHSVLLRLGLCGRQHAWPTLEESKSDVLYFPSEPGLEAEMDPDERIAVAAELLAQSPPGEINDVLNGLSDLPALSVVLTRSVATDIRTIIDDDVRLQKGIAGALEQYNLDQFVTVDAPDENHQVCSTPLVVFTSLTTVLQVIISEFGRVGDPKENRFIDPRSKKSFVFDHLRLVSQNTIVTCPILTHLTGGTRNSG